MLSFGLQNINRTFFLTPKPLNMLRGTLFVVSSVANTFFLLLFTVWIVIGHRHLCCCILTRRNIIRTWLLAFWLLLTYFTAYFEFLNAKYIHCALLVCWRSPKTQLLPFIRTLISKNISTTLFVVHLYLNMFFLHFSDILTSKCIHHSYLVLVCTLNTPSAPYFFVYNR